MSRPLTRAEAGRRGGLKVAATTDMRSLATKGRRELRARIRWISGELFTKREAPAAGTADASGRKEKGESMTTSILAHAAGGWPLPGDGAA